MSQNVPPRPGLSLIKKCYYASLTVIFNQNLDGSYSFPDGSIILNNKHNFCSCYISTSNLMQCKHQISILRQFDISKIDRCWHKRKGITMSSNLKSYLSPRLFSMDSYIDNDESNLDVFDNIINNDNSEIEKCYDTDMINVNIPDEIIDIIDINEQNENNIDSNKHKDTLSYQSYSTICDDLYNIMKKRKQYQNLLWVCY